MPDLERLRALLEAEPDDVFVNFGLAVELHKRREVEESLRRFARVIELDPDYVAAYQQRAQVLMELGRREEAIGSLEAGIEAARRKGERHAADDMGKMLSALRAGLEGS